MSRINIEIMGGGWITASGIGSISGSDGFSMSKGPLPKLRRQLLTTNPDQRWGRLDDYSKAGLITASIALKDAGIDSTKSNVKTGLIISTATGSSQVDRKYFDTVVPEDGLLSSPNLFAYTLPNCMLGEVSIRYGFTGPALVLSQRSPDMMNGIAGAVKFLNYGLCERVVGGYCNIEVDKVDSECKPGAVFLVMQKAGQESPLVYNGTALLYNSSEISGIVDLMQELIRNKLTESL